MKLLSIMMAVATATVAVPSEMSFNPNATPAPGAITLELNNTSVNNLMATFVPLLSYFVLNNQTFNLNISESVPVLYKFTLDSVHLNTVSGFTTKVFEEIPGTDQLHVKLGGIDIDMTMDANLEALYFIPFKASRVQVKNVTIDFTLEATSTDKVHW